MTRLILAGSTDEFEELLRRSLPDPFGVQVQRWREAVEDAADVKAIADRDPNVVVLGPDLPEETAFRLAGVFDRSHPGVAVLYAGEVGSDTWRNALAVGIRGVITPDAGEVEIRSEVERVLEISQHKRTVAQDQPAGPSSRVITVVSPKGGAGKTVVSSNLAVAIAEVRPREVVLVDLDLQFGDIAYALMLNPQHTMIDALGAGVEIDVAALKVYLTPWENELFVLCAPEEPAAGEEISAEAVGQILDLLASEFPFVIVDTGGGLSEHTLTALERSSDIIMIGDMDVPSVRNLRKAMDALDLLGMTTQVRHFILNRADSKVGLSPEDVAQAAAMPIDVEIPSSRQVPISLNEGRPLVRAHARSPVARKIEQLAARFVRIPVKAQSSGLFRR
jgi:pilus assembly protein CpaE